MKMLEFTDAQQSAGLI